MAVPGPVLACSPGGTACALMPCWTFDRELGMPEPRRWVLVPHEAFRGELDVVTVDEASHRVYAGKPKIEVVEAELVDAELKRLRGLVAVAASGIDWSETLAELERLRARLTQAGDILQRVRWVFDNDFDDNPDVARAVIAEIDGFFGPLPSVEASTDV